MFAIPFTSSCTASCRFSARVFKCIIDIVCDANIKPILTRQSEVTTDFKRHHTYINFFNVCHFIGLSDGPLMCGNTSLMITNTKITKLSDLSLILDVPPPSFCPLPLHHCRQGPRQNTGSPAVGLPAGGPRGRQTSRPSYCRRDKNPPPASAVTSRT